MKKHDIERSAVKDRGWGLVTELTRENNVRRDSAEKQAAPADDPGPGGRESDTLGIAQAPGRLRPEARHL